MGFLALKKGWGPLKMTLCRSARGEASLFWNFSFSGCLWFALILEARIHTPSDPVPLVNIPTSPKELNFLSN